VLCLTALGGRATQRLASAATPRLASAAATAQAAEPTYARHAPERTLLYALVQAHYPGFIAHLAAQDRSLPEYVREEFEAFLRCGELDHGFLRVVCEQCHADKFVCNEFEQP